VTPRWAVAPCFLVDEVVATANCYRDTLGFTFKRFWEDCNGYRLGFGHDTGG
jgi:hypothetical protein